MFKKKFRERKKEGFFKSTVKEIGEGILGEIVEAILSFVFRGIIRVIKHLI